MLVKLIQILVTLYSAFNKVSGAQQCYICLERCDRSWGVENCTERYGDVTSTSCVSVQAGSDFLTRKQCMSDAQAESFCHKFNKYEAVSCYACRDDLCNSEKMLTPTLIFIVVAIYCAVNII